MVLSSKRSSEIYYMYRMYKPDRILEMKLIESVSFCFLLYSGCVVHNEDNLICFTHDCGLVTQINGIIIK